MKIKHKGLIYTLSTLIVLLVILPNIINKRERKTFNHDIHLQQAVKKYNKKALSDSITIALSTFYDRGSLVKSIFGSHYRDVWATEITLPVIDLNKIHGGLKFIKLGGGGQTISADLESHNKKSYTMRSVNKDQARSLPYWLQLTAARPMFRDQACALNPYGALIANQFEEACDILHTSPNLYFVPFDSSMNIMLQANMSGRPVLLEEEPDESWEHHSVFGNADKILDTDELLPMLEKEHIEINVKKYLQCRLLDMLMSDWDRHEKQWAWAINIDRTGRKVASPIPMDRDMAFYMFNDGLLNQVTLLINNKFQSYTEHFEDVSGLIKNSKTLDLKILGKVKQEVFISKAEELQSILTDEIINSAFQVYPQPIFEKYGTKHINIFKSRLKQLPEVADQFYLLLNEEIE